MANGRFIGPIALIREAERMLPDLNGMMAFDWDWRKWIDLVEGSNMLVPILRWRVTQTVQQRLWDMHDERESDGEAAGAQTANALAALGRFNYARTMWGHAGFAPQHLHPLDDPRDGADAFIESPASVPWSPRTYDPVMVRCKGRDQPVPDNHGCIPIYRRWQALVLVEVALAGPRTLGGLRWATLSVRPKTPCVIRI